VIVMSFKIVSPLLLFSDRMTRGDYYMVVS
jgi:hypothetical protein